MKKGKLNILYSLLLLFCFIAGQYAVLTHQHLVAAGNTKTITYTHDHQSSQTLTEKCYLCDAMHHNIAVIDTPLYVIPQTASAYIFKTWQYDFVSISLVLAAGRAPPVLS